MIATIFPSVNTEVKLERHWTPKSNRSFNNAFAVRFVAPPGHYTAKVSAPAGNVATGSSG
ncbi:MAG: hypothetical protein ACYTBS_27495 [Planctomycetota bacterium]|jgi:hypothetical protein